MAILPSCWHPTRGMRAITHIVGQWEFEVQPVHPFHRKDHQIRLEVQMISGELSSCERRKIELQLMLGLDRVARLAFPNSYLVKKVTFKLHETYSSPLRSERSRPKTITRGY